MVGISSKCLVVSLLGIASSQSSASTDQAASAFELERAPHSVDVSPLKSEAVGQTARMVVPGTALHLKQIEGSITGVRLAQMDTTAQNTSPLTMPQPDILQDASLLICPDGGRACTDAVTHAFYDWLIEVSFDVAAAPYSAEALSALFRENMQGLGSPEARIAAFKTLVDDNHAMGSLRERLRAASIPSIKNASLDILDGIAFSLITAVVSEQLAQHYEANGLRGAASATRAGFEPLAQVVTATAAGSAGGLVAANISIWSRNIYTMAVLGGNLNQAQAAGTDVASQIEDLRADMASIQQTLHSNTLQGQFFADKFQNEPLTGDLRSILESTLDDYVRIEEDLIAVDRILNEGITGWVASMSRGFSEILNHLTTIPAASDQVYQTTPSLPSDLRQETADLNAESGSLLGFNFQDRENTSDTSSQAGGETIPIFGSHAAIPFDIADHCVRHLDWEPFERCLEDAGATSEAIEAAQALSGEGSTVFLSEYWSLGRVDAVETISASASNYAWHGFVIDQRKHLAAGFDAMDVRDRASQSLKGRYPDAVSYFPARISGHRYLQDGGQRFILTTVITDGCRACDVIAVAIGYVDFRNGREVNSGTIGWTMQIGDYPTKPTEVRRRLYEQDVREFQKQFNLRGYIAGSMDGVYGPATAKAVQDFENAYCLEVGGQNLEQVALLLSEVDQEKRFEPAPCGPSRPNTTGASQPTEFSFDAVTLSRLISNYWVFPQLSPGTNHPSASVSFVLNDTGRPKPGSMQFSVRDVPNERAAEQLYSSIRRAIIYASASTDWPDYAAYAGRTVEVSFDLADYYLRSETRAASSHPILGSWNGQYYCGQGLTSFRLTTTDEPIEDGTILGLFEFFPHPSNPGVPKGSFEVRIIMTGNSEFIVEPIQWIDRPRGFWMISSSGSIESESRISGFIDGSACGEFFAVAADEERQAYNQQDVTSGDDRTEEPSAATLGVDDNSRRADLQRSVEIMLQNGSGDLEALAGAMETNRLQMVARLEGGVKIEMPTTENFEVITSDNERRYRVSFSMKFPFRKLAFDERQQALEDRFSWDLFRQQSQTASISRPFRVYCFYRDISDIPQSRSFIDASLRSLSESNGTTYLHLNCR